MSTTRTRHAVSEPARSHDSAHAQAAAAAATARVVAAAPPGSILAAVRALDAAIVAVPPQAMLPITVDIPTMASTMLGCAGRIRALAGELATLPKYDATPASHVDDYAYALLDAHEHSLVATDNHVFDQRVARATTLRTRLFATLDLLVAWDELDGAIVADLRSGTGYKDLADDLLGCVHVLRDQPAASRARLLVTDADLEEASALAQQIHLAVGVRENGDAPDGVDPRVRRQQAYTLAVNAWGQIRRGVQFLRYAEGDADTIAPSLFVRSAPRRASGSDPTATTPGAAPPAAPPPTPPTVPNTVAAAVIPPAKNGGPFTS